MAKKKTEWRCYGQVVGSKYLGTVMASTKEEAEKLAEELDSMSVSLCHQCTEECEDAEVNEITVMADD